MIVKVFGAISIFVLLSMSGFSVSASDIPCIYPHKSSQEMAEHLGCATLTANGQLQLKPETLQRILFPESGVECLLMLQQSEVLAFYVKDTGESRSTLFVDNGCDYFEEGLARGYVDGKITYFDNSLTTAVKTEFEQGMPFYYAHAVVCNGPFVEEKTADHDHTLQSGGRCGLIDHQGKLVVPAEYPIEQDEAFEKYINANNECEPPPIKTEADALCHGRRHGKMLNYLSDNWTWHEINEKDGVWQLEFIQAEEPDQILIMDIDRDSAHWRSIVPKE